jgi:hypothetical protein
MEPKKEVGPSNEPCAYCGERPTWPIVWTDEEGTEIVLYLCAECDEEEISEFDRE